MRRLFGYKSAEELAAEAATKKAAEEKAAAAAKAIAEKAEYDARWGRTKSAGGVTPKRSAAEYQRRTNNTKAEWAKDKFDESVAPQPTRREQNTNLEARLSHSNFTHRDSKSYADHLNAKKTFWAERNKAAKSAHDELAHKNAEALKAAADALKTKVASDKKALQERLDAKLASFSYAQKHNAHANDLKAHKGSAKHKEVKNDADCAENAPFPTPAPR